MGHFPQKATEMDTSKRFEIQGDLFTPKEKESYKLLIQGFSKKGIANHTFKSVKTVEKYIDSIYKKLGVHNAAGAVHMGYIKRIIKLLLLIIGLSTPLVYDFANYLDPNDIRDNDIRRQKISRTIKVREGEGAA